MLIIQPVPCLNLGSPCHASCPDLHPGSALNNFLSSPDLSGHGAEAIGQGRIQGGSRRTPCRPLLVLVVQEICAGRYSAGATREGCERGEERIMG